MTRQTPSRRSKAASLAYSARRARARQRCCGSSLAMRCPMRAVSCSTAPSMTAPPRRGSDTCRRWLLCPQPARVLAARSTQTVVVDSQVVCLGQPQPARGATHRPPAAAECRVTRRPLRVLSSAGREALRMPHGERDADAGGAAPRRARRLARPARHRHPRRPRPDQRRSLSSRCLCASSRLLPPRPAACPEVSRAQPSSAEVTPPLPRAGRLSGGERKRVSVATEMMHTPSLPLLEPTPRPSPPPPTDPHL